MSKMLGPLRGDFFLLSLYSTSDLGIVVASLLSFCEHVTKITRKEQQRASLIHRLFTTKRLYWSRPLSYMFVPF